MYVKIMKKIIQIIKWLIVLCIIGILGFKILGTSYCYIKIPTTKEEANKVIRFCGRSDLLFDVFFSKARAKIYEKYPDTFQNEGSATELINYYSRNNILNHLERIENLTYVITDDVWNKEKNFYFILEDSDFEKKLPLEFRKKVFNKIYEKYYKIIQNEKEIDKENRNNLLNSINRIKNKLN